MEVDYTKKYGSRHYFFWNDKPYKVMREMRRKNLVTAWSLLENKRVVFNWADWKRNKEKAFLTSEVSEILQRGKHIICRNIDRKKIPSPYYIEIAKRGDPPFSKMYLWRLKDILFAREYFESVRSTYDVSEAEVKALVNDDQIIYFIQDSNGEFIPTWKAE